MAFLMYVMIVLSTCCNMSSLASGLGSFLSLHTSLVKAFHSASSADPCGHKVFDYHLVNVTRCTAAHVKDERGIGGVAVGGRCV